MNKTIKQTFVTIMMTSMFVIIFAWIPLSKVSAQNNFDTPNSTTRSTTSSSSSTTTSSGGSRIQDGLDKISDAYPDTIVDKNATPEDLAKRIIDIALYVSAIIAVIFVIYGGYQYIFAGGNDETAKSGRKTLTNALIGLAIIVLSFIIVQVVYRFLTNQ